MDNEKGGKIQAWTDKLPAGMDEWIPAQSELSEIDGIQKDLARIKQTIDLLSVSMPKEKAEEDQPSKKEKDSTSFYKSLAIKKFIEHADDKKFQLGSRDEKKSYVEKLILQIVDEEMTIPYKRLNIAKDVFVRDIVNDIVGFGPLNEFIEDDSISEIMVNGPGQIFVEKAGKLLLTDRKFNDSPHLMSIIQRIFSPIGRRIDESSPRADGRLPDGSRVHAIIPPVSIDGPVVTIRKFQKKTLQIEDMVYLGSINSNISYFLGAAVKAKLNILVVGGTGSGKTTLLNILGSLIPRGERIITIEDSAELQLKKYHEHVIRLETRPPNIEGRGEVTIRDNLREALRMRPDRIIVGEVRGSEAMDMLQAMNTGHEGSMTSMHANSPRDSLSRIAIMCMMGTMEISEKAIKAQIESALDIIIFAARLPDGSRKVTYITEVTGIENNEIAIQDIFSYEIEGIEDGKVTGKHICQNPNPLCLYKFRKHNINLPDEIFK